MNKTFANASQMDIIEDRLNSFAQIEHIDQLKNFFLPKIKEFSNKIDEFEQSNDNVRECIVEFDRSICLKADKDSFRTFQKHMEQYNRIKKL